MVSAGTDAARALTTMVRSVGLPSMSLPPSRAATSIWRISLANSLPRALSLAPFWCLMVAHFEWPDMLKTLLEEGGTVGGAGGRSPVRDGTRPPVPSPAGRGQGDRRGRRAPSRRGRLIRRAAPG